MGIQHGRDGPADEVRCRGVRIAAPAPAPSDQPPSESKAAFTYGSPSEGGSTTSPERVHGPGRYFLSAHHNPGVPGAAQGGLSGERTPPPFRGELKVECRFDGGVRRDWYLVTLSSPEWQDPPDEAVVSGESLLSSASDDRASSAKVSSQEVSLPAG